MRQSAGEECWREEVVLSHYGREHYRQCYKHQDDNEPAQYSAGRRKRVPQCVHPVTTDEKDCEELRCYADVGDETFYSAPGSREDPTLSDESYT